MTEHLLTLMPYPFFMPFSQMRTEIVKVADESVFLGYLLETLVEVVDLFLKLDEALGNA